MLKDLHLSQQHEGLQHTEFQPITSLVINKSFISSTFYSPLQTSNSHYNKHFQDTFTILSSTYIPSHTARLVFAYFSNILKSDDLLKDLLYSFVYYKELFFRIIITVINLRTFTDYQSASGRWRGRRPTSRSTTRTSTSGTNTKNFFAARAGSLKCTYGKILMCDLSF